MVLLRVSGQALIDALENGVSELPALEGRFCQVSGLAYKYDRSAPPMSRVTFARIGGQPIDPEHKYILATRGCMARGKDGFSPLLVQSEYGEAEELFCEEDGVLSSTILRQYSLSLKVISN